MSISVYRIYVSAGWCGSGDLDRLGAVLDRMPALLYRLDRVGERELQQALGDKPALETALRIAMTQSHIALARITAKCEPSRVEITERQFARVGFRRQIPIIGIVDGKSAEHVDAVSYHVDRVVTLDADSLAIAIQELTEQSVADRRRAHEIQLAKSSDQNAVVVEQSDGVQPLPYDQIVSAFEHLRALRGPAGTSVSCANLPATRPAG